MTFWTKRLVTLGFLLILVNCTGYRKVYVNYDRSVDFVGYNTFAWAPDSSTVIGDDVEKPVYDTDIVRNNAKNYITHSLSQRGYLVNIDSPDVVLQLVLLNEEKERIVTRYGNLYSGYYFYNPYYFPYYYPRYRFYTWYGWGYPPFWNVPVSQHTETYVKGTITLNIYDRKLKKLVWTGSTEGNIYDPEYIHFDVHPAVDRIMAKFPVGPVHKQGTKKSLKSNNRDIRTNGMNREIIDPVYPLVE